MNNEKINSEIKVSNNSSFVILIFVILNFRNIRRSTFRRSKSWKSVISLRLWKGREGQIWMFTNFDSEVKINSEVLSN